MRETQEINSQFEGIMSRERLLPTWQLAKDAFPELEQQARIDAVRFTGSVAIRGEAGEVIAAQPKNESSLMTAAQEAAMGDVRGRNVLKNNASTDVAERLYKAGHQTKVHMEVIGGYFQQDGRRMIDLHRSTLEHTVLVGEMFDRTKREIRNLTLFERLHAAGIFETHDAAVFSTSSTQMTQEEKEQYGMFVATETCSLQLLSASGNQLELGTALVAGKRTPDSERHDIETIHKLAAARGIQLETSDGTEMISQVMLIPKGEVTGVEDIVEWYDDAAGGTFYGEDKPRQDYKEHAIVCQERTDGFEDMVENIVNQLMADAHTFRTPMDAIMRLDELSALYSRQYAIKDRDINLMVFGKEAAVHLQDARLFMEMGQMDRFDDAMSLAAKSDNSSSCPLFKNGSSSGGGVEDASGGSEEAEMAEKKHGKCPFCRAPVFVDPCAKRIECWDCKAMASNGAIISQGNGGSAKRRAEAEARRKERLDAKQAQLAGSLALTA
ncbi:MAG TPA: hypothetical protein VLA92_03075, partial [Candidatus Saccharimonadales bacterium]|nr:hypothetical protein [Candidatus Saccharimonadales bacterium]